MTEQDFDAATRSSIEEEPRALLVGCGRFHFCTLGRMAGRGLSPALGSNFASGMALSNRSGGTPPLRAISTMHVIELPIE